MKTRQFITLAVIWLVSCWLSIYTLHKVNEYHVWFFEMYDNVVEVENYVHDKKWEIYSDSFKLDTIIDILKWQL